MEFFMDRIFFPGMILLLVSFLVVVPIACVMDQRQHHALMEQCMADGHKEYECVSLLRERPSQSPMLVPLLIPSGGR